MYTRLFSKIMPRETNCKTVIFKEEGCAILAEKKPFSDLNDFLFGFFNFSFPLPASDLLFLVQLLARFLRFSV